MVVIHIVLQHDWRERLKHFVFISLERTSAELTSDRARLVVRSKRRERSILREEKGENEVGDKCSSLN